MNGIFVVAQIRSDSRKPELPFIGNPNMHPRMQAEGLRLEHQEALKNSTAMVVRTYSPVILNEVQIIEREEGLPAGTRVLVSRNGRLTPLCTVYHPDWLTQFEIGDLYAREELEERGVEPVWVPENGTMKRQDCVSVRDEKDSAFAPHRTIVVATNRSEDEIQALLSALRAARYTAHIDAENAVVCYLSCNAALDSVMSKIDALWHVKQWVEVLPRTFQRTDGVRVSHGSNGCSSVRAQRPLEDVRALWNTHSRLELDEATAEALAKGAPFEIPQSEAETMEQIDKLWPVEVKNA